MKTKLNMAKPQHEIAYQEIVALVNKHAGHLDSIEMLAVAANALGKMIALQDQRKWSGPQVMEIVAQNIEYGNKQVLDQLMQSKGAS